MQANKIYKMRLIDLYIKHNKDRDDSLWVVTESSVAKDRPELNHSLVHFRNGTASGYLDGTETKVEDDNIWYDYKKKHIVVAPKWLGAPAYEHHVDRYVGDQLGKNSKLFDYTDSMVRINYEDRYFDKVYNRIIFILDKKQMSNSPRGIIKKDLPVLPKPTS